MQGALVRSFTKDDAITSLDWDLKNYKGIPIAGGIYLIHIKVDIWEIPPIETSLGTTPGVGLTSHERIIKWYGVLRQPELDNL